MLSPTAGNPPNSAMKPVRPTCRSHPPGRSWPIARPRARQARRHRGSASPASVVDDIVWHLAEGMSSLVDLSRRPVPRPDPPLVSTPANPPYSSITKAISSSASVRVRSAAGSGSVVQHDHRASASSRPAVAVGIRVTQQVVQVHDAEQVIGGSAPSTRGSGCGRWPSCLAPRAPGSSAGENHVDAGPRKIDRVLGGRGSGSRDAVQQGGPGPRVVHRSRAKSATMCSRSRTVAECSTSCTGSMRSAFAAAGSGQAANPLDRPAEYRQIRRWWTSASLSATASGRAMAEFFRRRARRGHLHHGGEHHRQHRADGDAHGDGHTDAAEQLTQARTDERFGDVADQQPGHGDTQLGAREHERGAPCHAPARGPPRRPAPRARALSRDRSTAMKANSWATK